MNIRKARKKAGLTQEDLAQRIGMNRATVSKYESGQIEPSISMLRKICTALECDLAEIMTLDEMSLKIADVLDRVQIGIDSFKKEQDHEYSERMRPKAERFLLEENGRVIISAYYLLNEDGQYEAAKRIVELADIPKYKRTDGTEPPAIPTEGNTPTTQEKPPEGQTAPTDGK